MKRAIFLAVLGLGIIALALVIDRWIETAPDRPTVPAIEDDGGTLVTPGFDLVRVEADGSGILAGHARGGNQIALFIDGHYYQAQTANDRGEWVVKLTTPLAPGNHEVTLHALRPDGSMVPVGERVIVNVPAPAKDAAPPLAIVVPENTASPSGQGPDQAASAPASSPLVSDGAGDSSDAPPSASTDQESDIVPLRIDRLVSGPGRDAVLSGMAQPGSVVTVTPSPSQSPSLVYRAATNDKGRWQLTFPPPGAALLASMIVVERQDSGGKAGERVDIAVRWLPEITLLPAGTRIVMVRRGQNLWRIAKEYYGDGRLASMIAAANTQIGKQKILQPGQILILPPRPEK